MNYKLTTKLLTILTFLISINAFSQEGIVSGTLNDNRGYPIPGVTVIVKGTNRGVATDLDGQYSIKCRVGDILVFSTLGMQSKEVIINNAMFGKDFSTLILEKIAVEPITSVAYKNAIKSINNTGLTIPNIENSGRTYNKRSHFEYNRIKDIEVGQDHVKLTYFNPDIFYEIGYKTINSFQFVKNNNLPELQTVFSQGASSNGELSFQGAETGNIFSYGPAINTLEFNGSNYEYDTNGQLVSIGNGTGNKSKIYDNALFNTSLKTLNNLFFNITTDHYFLGFDFTNKTQKDLYGKETSHSNDFILKYKDYTTSQGKLNWDTFVKYSSLINNQPNINGFHNNLLLNQWITPISFSNKQGTVLSNNSQRSFGPNLFNNPEWLLNNNRNSEKNDLFVASVQNKLKVTKTIKMESKINYTSQKNIQNFGLVKNTVGFNDGYLSNRTVEKNNLNTVLNFNYDKATSFSKIDITSIANYTYEDLKYNLHQASGFEDFSFNNAQNSTTNNRSLHRNTLRLLNKFRYNFRETDIGISSALINNSYISSAQNNKWFLPTLQFKINFEDIFNIYRISNVSISANTSWNINDMSLLYTNQSHNSLNLTPSESLEYTAFNDLFLNNSLQLEEKESYDLNAGLNFYLFESYFYFGFTYFNTKTKGAVFPIIEDNAFQLKNIANVKNKGFEISLSTRIGHSYGNIYYRPSIVFSNYRTKVTKLLDGSDRIPIAGFSTTSKNLIVGKPAGVIVGSAYARDSNNNIIIGTNGFPLIDTESRIIGDPTPRYNLGFDNLFKWGDFKLSFIIDFQKGGDVWNGTQNTLNYFGTSQQSANERSITNFVFNGVTQQGNTNTVPIDFYNPTNDISENKFVRYGFGGVAEDAIVDGSYINLKSIDLLYSIKNNTENTFIRNLDIGIYGNNLLTWSKFKGASPYSSLYNTASGQGLNFFNTPVISEIGLKINVKI
ncbi:carboxypeptidase-like regulatory domain-containing protein [Flavivirga aquimarina]|uniref:Carboxypeptidase-like regulatory domain-containing protein n=1 Tax=Flavivirga aquimarina TaxID=2027862 RepID=A0ABT8WB70_9FLAO|nr:carboxypeptidase-like regulatory domain-containing protein [Flavivirga aquimarina]MDO5970379.1 carboxypeptidase-like regulatory domain-containing protein [Flavivirga aquimarina]